MTSYNYNNNSYYGWGPGLGFPLGGGYPYGSQSQGLNLSSPTGNPLSGPGPSGINQPSTQSGTQPNISQPPQSEDDLEFVNMEMKVLSPQNKDYHMYTLRHISRDVDSPEKLKADLQAV